jgi:predicted nucleic acid-binding protein
MIVVDTNIIAHFWLPSSQSDLCDQLFQKEPHWTAPVLWRSEFRNVVLLYLRKDLISLSQAMLITEKAETQMFEREFHVNSNRVLEIGERSSCSAYDCEFISLARDLDIQLVTLDKQILKDFPGISSHPEDII